MLDGACSSAPKFASESQPHLQNRKFGTSCQTASVETVKQRISKNTRVGAFIAPVATIFG